MDTNTALSGLEPLIGVEELSEYLDVPVKTLYEWHQSGKGPAAVRVGRRLRYLICDVRSWRWGHDRMAYPPESRLPAFKA